MAGHRKEAEKFIIEMIESLLPGGGNDSIYTKLFASMSDAEFDTFISSLESGENKLAIITPNLTKNKLSFERNLLIGDKLGHNFFERIWIDNGDDTPPYLSPIPYLIVDLPLRRQAQLLIKKISIPEDNKSIDELSGQPTGKSKGSKISYPEVQILAALNLDESLTELMKARGGDLAMFNAMNTSISRTGGVSLKAIDTGNTEVASNVTLKTLLTSMHLKSTL